MGGADGHHLPRVLDRLACVADQDGEPPPRETGGPASTGRQSAKGDPSGAYAGTHVAPDFRGSFTKTEGGAGKGQRPSLLGKSPFEAACSTSERLPPWP